MITFDDSKLYWLDAILDIGKEGGGQRGRKSLDSLEWLLTLGI